MTNHSINCFRKQETNISMLPEGKNVFGHQNYFRNSLSSYYSSKRLLTCRNANYPPCVLSKQNYIKLIDQAYPALRFQISKIIKTQHRNEATTEGFLSWSICKRIRNLLSLPVVFADGPDTKTKENWMESDASQGKQSSPSAEDSQQGRQSDPSATDVMKARMGSRTVYDFDVVTDADIDEYIAKETGLDRLKQMYGLSKQGQLSTELSLSIQLCLLTSVVIMQVSYLKSRNDLITKMKVKNLGWVALRKAGSNTLRYSAALLIALLVSQSIAVYRNKTSVYEYFAGATAATTLIRLPVLQNMLQSILFGAIMGVIWGAVFRITASLTHQTQEERHRKEVEELLLDQDD